MKTLIELTDWTKTTAKRGRGVGNEIVSRLVLAGSNWDWTVAVQRKGFDPKGESFYGSMRMLLPALEGHGVDFQRAVADIINTLVIRTGIKSPFGTIPRLPTYEDKQDFGAQIDRLWGTSYLKTYGVEGRTEYPPNVAQRIFGEAEVTAEAA